MGHRNPQGLYFDEENNFILETEHGPMGGDEINLIETGVSGHLDYGLFGLFFAHVVDQYGGQMHSVDLNCESCLSSETIFRPDP